MARRSIYNTRWLNCPHLTICRYKRHPQGRADHPRYMEFFLKRPMSTSTDMSKVLCGITNITNSKRSAAMSIACPLPSLIRCCETCHWNSQFHMVQWFRLNPSQVFPRDSTQVLLTWFDPTFLAVFNSVFPTWFHPPFFTGFRSGFLVPFDSRLMCLFSIRVT